MKISENWLQSFVNSGCDITELTEKLTMAGLEVGSLEKPAKFSKVYIGQIKTIEKVPNSKKLSLCTVDVGRNKDLTIVCGAKNVAVAAKVAVAIVGAKLPGDFTIAKRSVGGIESEGMLCSMQELKLSDESDGIAILDPSMSIGENLFSLLELADNIIDIELTPNRGDCLSMLGVAREIGVLCKKNINAPEVSTVAAKVKDEIKIDILEPAAAPAYFMRALYDIDNSQATPIWIAERLRKAGIKAISAVVDILNYVMLEIGQPLHAFAADKLGKEIIVRKANKNEKITLLDNTSVTLSSDTLVIANKQQAVAIAGVMGDLATSVCANSKDIIVECAYFNSVNIAGVARQYGVQSEAAQRFERGVDFNLQKSALERVFQLLIAVVGGKPGKVNSVVSKQHLPVRNAINLRRERIIRILGTTIADKEIADILQRLGMQNKATKYGWNVKPPSYRFDISIEADLIEEIARVYGYNKIPTSASQASITFQNKSHNKRDLSYFSRKLANIGYQEVITYSFVDPGLQEQLDPEITALQLINPISQDMSVMRTTMWSGLLKTLLHNSHRQVENLHIFETGLVYKNFNNKLEQSLKIAGLVYGSKQPKSWCAKSNELDFYDIKGDIENILGVNFAASEYSFVAHKHNALHPGRSAALLYNNKQVGLLGSLHPKILQKLDIKGIVYLFELDYAAICRFVIPKFQEVSKFPTIKRDLAIVVANSILVNDIKKAVVSAAKELLKNIEVFDVYHDASIGHDKKSVALTLTLQHDIRTLIDSEVNEVMQAVVSNLKDKFSATMRD